jgi:ankyrin repeat protein
MSQFLPLRADIEWLKKTAKERLTALRATDPTAKLHDAQLAIAREYGFPSWRKLVGHVKEVRAQLHESLPEAFSARPANEAPVPADDPELAQLFAAIESGESAAIKQLLSRRPALANARGRDGQTPLHAAARFNDPEQGVILLAYGADPYARFGESAHTALSWAVVCNAMEFAHLLVRLAIKPDLYSAAGMGALDIIKTLFDNSGRLLPDSVQTGSTRLGPDGSRLPCPPPTETERISDALCMACRNGHLEVARFLLAKNPDLTFRGYMGAGPLHWAYFGGSRSIVELLKNAGADPAARDDVLHSTPRAFGICAPANWGFEFLVRKRLAEDPSLANPGDSQTSPLHEAASNGHAAIVRLLLAHGADSAFRNSAGKTALDLARERGHHEVVALLEQIGT